MSALNGGTASNNVTTGCFAGYCDWRLPTIEELLGIFDVTQGFCGGGAGFCIDPIFGPADLGIFWTQSTDEQDPSSALVLGLNVSVSPKVNPAYARAVRGGL